MTTSQADLERVMTIIWQFVQDFGLCLSLEKTKIWGTCIRGLSEVAQRWGVAATRTLAALGMEWPISRTATPEYKKELSRIQECKTRILRLSHLPSPFGVKCQVLWAGCLSLMVYSAIPVRKAMVGLNALIKKALGHPWAAPEVLYYMIVRTPLDPVAVWFMSLLRFVYHAINTELTGWCLTHLTRDASIVDMWRFIST